MKILKTLNRIDKLHTLIKEEKTGTPDSLSEKLCISRATLYKIIEELRSYDAPIKYSRLKESFYYETPFTIEIKCILQLTNDSLD